MDPIEYTDYIMHARTPGSKNGVSNTEGYTAVGKPAMSEAERKARRKLYYKSKKKDKENDKGKDGPNISQLLDSTQKNLSTAIDSLWSPNKKKGNEGVYHMPTKKIESMNRRQRAIDEYIRNNPNKQERAKQKTLNIIKGVGALTVAAASGVVLIDKGYDAVKHLLHKE